MENFVVKPLSVDTWDAFARLVERHNGVFGGCWCTWFHTFHAEKTFTAEGNHALKEQLVKEDRAHAALVYDGDEAVAWAQYGPPGELPNIHHRKEYEETLDKLPDYRSLASSSTRSTDEKGVTAIALRGRDRPDRAGRRRSRGGVPTRHTDGKKVSVLYNATRSPVRGGGFRVPPPQRQEELCDAQDRA